MRLIGAWTPGVLLCRAIQDSSGCHKFACYVRRPAPAFSVRLLRAEISVSSNQLYRLGDVHRPLAVPPGSISGSRASLGPFGGPRPVYRGPLSSQSRICVGAAGVATLAPLFPWGFPAAVFELGHFNCAQVTPTASYVTYLGRRAQHVAIEGLFLFALEFRGFGACWAQVSCLA